MNSGKQQIVIKQNNFEELIRQKNYDLHQQKIEEIKKSQHSKKTMSMDARNMDILAFNRSQYKQLKMNESFMENNINKNNLMIFEKLKYISNRQSDYGMHQTPQANRKSSLQSQYAQNQKLKQNLALVKRIENVQIYQYMINQLIIYIENQ